MHFLLTVVFSYVCTYMYHIFFSILSNLPSGFLVVLILIPYIVVKCVYWLDFSNWDNIMLIIKNSLFSEVDIFITYYGCEFESKELGSMSQSDIFPRANQEISTFFFIDYYPIFWSEQISFIYSAISRPLIHLESWNWFHWIQKALKIIFTCNKYFFKNHFLAINDT